MDEKVKYFSHRRQQFALIKKMAILRQIYFMWFLSEFVVISQLQEWCVFVVVFISECLLICVNRYKLAGTEMHL